MKRIWLWTIALAILSTGGSVLAADWIPFIPGASEGAPFEVRLLATSEESTRLEVIVPGAWVEDTRLLGETFQTLRIPGAGTTHDIGSPELPVIGRRLLVGDHGEYAVRILDQEEFLLSGYRIAPAQVSPDRCGDPAEPVIKEAAYQQDGLWPAEPAALDAPTILRSVRTQRAAVHPVRYHPLRDELTINPRTVVEIFRARPTGSNELLRDEPLPPTFRHAISQVVINPQLLERGDRDTAERMLVICRDAYADEIQSLVAWKIQMGIDVTVALTSETGTSASQIQSYIQTVWTTWNPQPTYILLVGNNSHIQSLTGIGSCASDEMFTLLEGSDIAPDVFIGRLTADDETELEIQVAKLLDYDRYPATGAQGLWMNKGASFSSSDSGPYGISDDVRLNGISDAMIAHGMDPSWDKLYISNGQGTTANIANVVNDGRGWIAYMGHGSGTSWSSPYFANSNVDSLTNSDEWPFCMDVSCDNGGYTGSSDCFAERWMKHGTPEDPRGTVSMYSSTTSTAWEESAILAQGVGWALTDYGHTHLGAMTWRGMMHLEEQEGSGSAVVEVFNQYLLFGDPSLRFRSDTAGVVDLTTVPQIPMGAFDLEVTVAVEGSPVEDALVCCMKEGEVYAVGTTGPDGMVIIPVQPATIGELLVTVTGYNLAPTEAIIPVQVSGCGVVRLDRSAYNCQDQAVVQLWDDDLDTTGAPDQVDVLVTSDSDPAGELVTLMETAGDSGEFSGSVALTANGAGAAVAVSHGDLLVVTYQDADCEGAPDTATDQADMDCQGPDIANMQVLDVMYDSATVRWTTDEPSVTELRYGDIPPFDTVIREEAMVTEHEVVITDLDSCVFYYFALVAEDAGGNITMDDDGGLYHRFLTLGREVVLEADMDTDPGWVAQGQWAWGSPTGGGGSYGSPDPSSGATGNHVYGYNLNGDYANSMSEMHLTTPAFDCSEGVGVTVTFQRWLGVERSYYDHAYLKISTNGGSSWSNVWANPDDSMDGGSWDSMSYDLSTWADGESDVRLRWTMGATDSGWTYCGWNIDDVSVFFDTECDLPTPTPFPTSTPEPTPTPFPTSTPEATFTPEPEPTMTPEPTPADPFIRLLMDDLDLQPGETFLLERLFGNPTQQALAVDEYIILDVANAYYFWPRWTLEMECVTWTLPAGSNDTETILNFPWPDGAGNLNGIRFWGAFMAEGTMDLVDYDMVEWGFSM